MAAAPRYSTEILRELAAARNRRLGTVRRMAFPRFSDKHGHEEFVTPAAIREWRRARGMLPDRSPESVIMLYQDELFAGVVGFEATRPLGGQGIYRRAVTLDRTDSRVAVIGGFGIGAPVAAIVLEELIAIGV